MMEGVIMINKIKILLDSIKQNPHWLSQKANLTYRVVLRLYKADTIPPTTPIGTLWSIAKVLGVKIDDLYEAIPQPQERG